MFGILPRPPAKKLWRVHIKELRRKLQETGAPKDLITTVYRTGYRLNPMYSETVADLDGNGVSMAQVAELRAVNEDLRPSP